MIIIGWNKIWAPGKWTEKGRKGRGGWKKEIGGGKDGGKGGEGKASGWKGGEGLGSCKPWS